MNLKPDCPQCGGSTRRIYEGSQSISLWLLIEILSIAVILIALMYSGIVFVIALLVGIAVFYVDIRQPRLYECVSCHSRFYFPSRSEKAR